MNCPNCQWKRIKEGRQNYIHEKPTGNDIYIGVKILDQFVDVLICDSCGFSWLRGEKQ